MGLKLRSFSGAVGIRRRFGSVRMLKFCNLKELLPFGALRALQFPGSDRAFDCTFQEAETVGNPYPFCYPQGDEAGRF
jgi:hypothetical protein